MTLLAASFVCMVGIYRANHSVAQVNKVLVVGNFDESIKAVFSEYIEFTCQLANVAVG